MPEDGGVTHEVISTRRPQTEHRSPAGWVLMPTEVSLSTTDHHVAGQWTRPAPTVQVEGGSYSLDGARELRDALSEFLARVASDTGPGNPRSGQG
jgi:hypothetical protein